MAKVQILILDEIGPEFWGLISAKTVYDQLVLLKDGDDLEVLINSPGGFVDEGLSIFNLLIEEGKKRKVITKNIGQAASIAALIYLGGTERIMMPGSKLMIHQASSGEWGKGEDLIKKGEALIEESNNIFDLMMNRSDKMKSNESKLREYFDAEKYIFADECVELGIAHKVEDLPKASKFSNNKMFSIMFDLKKFQTTMSKLDKFLSGKKMASIQTDGDNATTIYYDGELKEGTAVFSDEAMTTALADGDYVIGGSTYTVKDGKITSVAVTSDSADDAAAAAKAAADATALAEQRIVNSMKGFADGEYSVNGKNYIVKAGEVSMKIDTNPVVDITKDPAFIQMQADLKLMKAEQAKIQSDKKLLEKENSEMKTVIAEVKKIGFGEGLDNDKNVPAGYEMKDGQLVKKAFDKMTRKERLLMTAEAMENARETATS